MPKFVVGCLFLALTVLLGFVPPSSATPEPLRSVSVTGTEAEMYPEFGPTVTRYALTTGSATAGVVTVTASTSDPAGQVLVNGAPVSGPAQVSGLVSGDEISVIITDTTGRTAYSVIYLPAGFPKIRTTTYGAGVAEGYVGLTLNTFEQSPLPAYDAIIDRNGVPVYAVPALGSDLDLKQQPDGEITVQRLTQANGLTGTDVVTLDDQLAESARRHVLTPLTNTDGHDSVRMADGSTILIGYEPNPGTGKTDATIQKLDPQGAVTFTWSSASIASETTASSQAQGVAGDYAHINSVVPSSNGDVIASFRHLSAVLRIATVAHGAYQPGDIIWRLGGRHSDFTFVDDPFPAGPCAQHTASELPSGHIMVFDNGSSGLCVDPNDPTGATITRGETRISEYALDTGAGTATLVWNYAPPSTYALFAGSARRLGNGNTLIGWADDRDVLATEVSADRQVLWDATTPAALEGHKKYMTYRAEPITDLTDAIKPAAVLTGPADNAVLKVGAVANGSATCTDRGGSNLQSCVTTGLVNGRLNTTAPGARTWQATATDGDGNTITATRHYTVRAPYRVADGWIQASGSSTWKGNNVYGSATKQTISQSARRGRSVSAYWKVQNDGEQTDTMRLSAIGSGAGFTIHYFSGDRDITGAVVAGTYRTTSLAPGRTNTLKVVVKPTTSAGVGTVRSVFMRATPINTTIGTDLVRTQVTALR